MDPPPQAALEMQELPPSSPTSPSHGNQAAFPIKSLTRTPTAASAKRSRWIDQVRRPVLNELPPDKLDKVHQLLAATQPHSLFMLTQSLPASRRRISGDPGLDTGWRCAMSTAFVLGLPDRALTGPALRPIVEALAPELRFLSLQALARLTDAALDALYDTDVALVLLQAADVMPKESVHRLLQKALNKNPCHPTLIRDFMPLMSDAQVDTAFDAAFRNYNTPAQVSTLIEGLLKRPDPPLGRVFDALDRMNRADAWAAIDAIAKSAGSWSGAQQKTLVDRILAAPASTQQAGALAKLCSVIGALQPDLREDVVTFLTNPATDASVASAALAGFGHSMGALSADEGDIPGQRSRILDAAERMNDAAAWRDGMIPAIRHLDGAGQDRIIAFVAGQTGTDPGSLLQALAAEIEHLGKGRQKVVLDLVATSASDPGNALAGAVLDVVFKQPIEGLDALRKRLVDVALDPEASYHDSLLRALAAELPRIGDRASKVVETIADKNNAHAALRTIPSIDLVASGSPARRRIVSLVSATIRSSRPMALPLAMKHFDRAEKAALFREVMREIVRTQGIETEAVEALGAAAVDFPLPDQNGVVDFLLSIRSARRRGIALSALLRGAQALPVGDMSSWNALVFRDHVGPQGGEPDFEAAARVRAAVLGCRPLPDDSTEPMLRFPRSGSAD